MNDQYHIEWSDVNGKHHYKLLTLESCLRYKNFIQDSGGTQISIKGLPLTSPTLHTAGVIEQIVKQAISDYGRTNTDEVWRVKEAEHVVERLRNQGFLKEGK